MVHWWVLVHYDQEIPIVKHPTPIVMIGWFKTRISSLIIFITLFFTKCTTLLRLLQASTNTEYMQEQNYFREQNL